MGISIAWSLGPEFPDSIKCGAIGVVDNYVVHAGGCSWPWRERETGWWLNPAEKEWKPLPPMPEGRAYTQGVTANNSLFVIGGRKRTGGQFGVVHKNCWRLSRKEGGWHWDMLPELHQGRAVPALAAVGNTIYCVGGGGWITGFFAPDDVSIDEYLDLDNLEQGWQEMPRCPGGRRAIAAATSANGKIYMFGGGYGRSGEGSGGSNGRKLWKSGEGIWGYRYWDAWCFDPKAGEWHEIARLPFNALSGAAAVTYDDRYIILVGGAVSQEEGSLAIAHSYYQEDEKRRVRIGWCNDRVLVYDVQTDKYEELSEPLPYGSHDIRATIMNDTIYAIGGENGDFSVSHTCPTVRVGKVQKL